MKYAKLTTMLLLLFGCSFVSSKNIVPETTPFTTEEATYIKMLFNQSNSGWLAKEDAVLRAMRPTVVESLRNHPKEILPVLISGWENGWKNYPWKSSDLPPVWLLKNNRNLLDLIICLDPKEAEKMLVKAFDPEPFQENSQARLDEREEILIVLYWKLHSNQWKPLLKPLAERGERNYTRLYIVWCAQENDKDGLELAEAQLKKEETEHSGERSPQYQSYVYQLRGDVEGLKALCRQYHYDEGANSGFRYPLWSLSFMKRDDVVTDFANGHYRPELKKLAKGILVCAEKWRETRSTNPCEVEMKGIQGFGTSDTMAHSRYSGGPRI